MIEFLPQHLLERTCVQEGKVLTENAGKNEFVLYWMQTAVRVDENPALDVAKWIAFRQGVPLLVYQAVSENYKFASDRHHTFILQGARDVQAAFAKMGIAFAFHLASSKDRRPHLLNLAKQASVVVREDMPTDPSRRFAKVLKCKTEKPIVVVDTACVVPMQLAKRAFTRAFEYRSATKVHYSERLNQSWPTSTVEPQPFDLGKIPFRPIDLESTKIDCLISTCEIDHTIGPVFDTPGGSLAGYKRWQTFKENQLALYAKQRNNPLLAGVSRMSPYLHYGMVSPLRIAREAADCNNSGSEKFLDELLIWRELAYVFCFYREDHDRWSALPEWAQNTLQRHASDHRDEYSWEQLARGETNDEFWNACQKSLLMQGELHNNARMTWGKAILNWKRSPQEALSTIIDLNHRYALDGRDPASFGGILWRLGQFDRPFETEQEIIGTLRPRPIVNHAMRLDTQKFMAKVTKPRFDPSLKVAIIGAGISGLVAARTLQDHGVHVTVFDKGRGIGGRMSTRRVDDQGEQMTFDHGAQYFTARDPRFKRYIHSWIEQDIVALWPDKRLGNDQQIVVLDKGEMKSKSSSVQRFVAIPHMNSICTHLAKNLRIQTQTRVARISRAEERVELYEESGSSLGIFDRIVVSAPAQQTAELLVDFPELAEETSSFTMKPCFATMAGFDKPLTCEWAGAFINSSFLTWAARTGTKPGRNNKLEQLVVHASPEWTTKNWDMDPDEVAKLMLEEFWNVSGISQKDHNFLTSHRWKFAIPEAPSERRCFTDKSKVVFCCGDWASGSRVEGAFLSGAAAAGRVFGTFSLHQQIDKETQTLLF